MVSKATLYKIEERIQQRVGNLLGEGPIPATLQFGQTDIAETSGNAITLNKQYVLSHNRREIAGVLAHELTHVAQAGRGGLSGEKVEALADSVRSTLGLGTGGGYNSKFERRLDNLGRTGVRDVYQAVVNGRNVGATLRREERDVAGVNQGGGHSGPSLPGQGNQGGRMRNTFANLLSKNQTNYKNPGGAAALPALSPDQVANYYGQLGQLYSGYQNTISALRNQRVGLRQGFASAREDIKGQLISGLASQQNADIERGVSGSSASSQSLAGLRGQAASMTQQAKGEMLQGIAGTRIAQQQAATDYASQSLQLQQGVLAQQQDALAQQLQNNLIISGQESTMDAMKGIYDAFIKAFGPDGKRKKPDQGGNGQGFTLPPSAIQPQGPYYGENPNGGSNNRGQGNAYAPY